MTRGSVQSRGNVHLLNISVAFRKCLICRDIALFSPTSNRNRDHGLARPHLDDGLGLQGVERRRSNTTTTYYRTIGNPIPLLKFQYLLNNERFFKQFLNTPANGRNAENQQKDRSHVTTLSGCISTHRTISTWAWSTMEGSLAGLGSRDGSFLSSAGLEIGEYGGGGRKKKVVSVFAANVNG